jgi:predicted MFS family arabinose efflux permease
VAGLNGVLAILAAFSGFAMLLAPLLPAHGRTPRCAEVRMTLVRPATLIGLVGCGTFFVNAGAYWTYIELMGQAQGISSRVVADCIAAGVSAGILGGGAAWALGDRFGKLFPLGVAAFLTVAAALLLNGSFGVIAFMLSNLLYFFAWNYSLAYQFAAINAVDATGRGVAIAGAFGYLGAAGGAALAATLVAPRDYGSITWLVVLAVCLSTVLFAVSFGIHKYATAPLNA